MSTAITPAGGGSANQPDYSAFGAVEWRPRSCIQEYYHIGVAMDVANGLVVPVVRSADARTFEEIAADVSSLRDEARGKGLPLIKMSGGSFTISSLGAIGGLGFTPNIAGCRTILELLPSCCPVLPTSLTG
jgi:pyruvate/2-oxoglutarate dehydrogenase complex dihydrolipoamide acyltransferase (E2) component